MDFTQVKSCVADCPELMNLPADTLALLFWRGEEEQFLKGQDVYTQADTLDDTFCVLLAGELSVERNGTVLGMISPVQVFGEMAYFTALPTRTATVRVASGDVTVLRIRLTPAELASSQWKALKKFLGLQAWERFVDATQNRP